MKQSKFSESQIMAILKEGDAGVAMYADLALKNAAIKDVSKNNREWLAVKIGASIQSSRVVRVLNRLIDLYSKPAVLHGQRLAGMDYQMDSAFVPDISFAWASWLFLRAARTRKPYQHQRREYLDAMQAVGRRLLVETPARLACLRPVCSNADR